MFTSVRANADSRRIAVTTAHAARDPPDQPFLTVPNAILYHDKERLNRGRLIIRKVEMDGCAPRIGRARDVKWNLASDETRGLPTSRFRRSW